MSDTEHIIRASAVVVEHAEQVIVQASRLEQPDLYPRVRTLENQLERINRELAEKKRQFEMIKKQNADMRKENKKIKKEEKDRLFTISAQQEEIAELKLINHGYIGMLKCGAKYGWVTSDSGFRPRTDKKGDMWIQGEWRFITQERNGIKTRLHRDETWRQLTNHRDEIHMLRKKCDIQEKLVKHLKKVKDITEQTFN